MLNSIGAFISTDASVHRKALPECATFAQLTRMLGVAPDCSFATADKPNLTLPPWDSLMTVRAALEAVPFLMLR